jgi:DNA-binding MarR family transcriptional regulator
MFASPPLIVKLSPAIKLVLKVLERNKWMNQKQIIAKTFLSPRTAKYAVKNLKEKGLPREKCDFNNLRKKYHAIEKGKIYPITILIA